MPWGIRAEPADRLLALALRADVAAAAGLVGEDDGVHEALEEVALTGVGGAPGRLELLVGLEVGAVSRKLEAALIGADDVRVAGRHGEDRARRRRPGPP